MKPKEQKQAEARERQEMWQQLSPTEQKRALDLRLGVDKGAKRQRTRIEAKL